MKNINTVELHPGSKEELLPGFTLDFPYIASRVEFDKFIDQTVPWHWHNTVELFYMESGSLEYYTPKGKITFPKGSGGMVNSNVLHMTRPRVEEKSNIQLLHIFSPSFISGQQGSIIEQKYVKPIVLSSQIEIIPLYPDHPEQANLLETLRQSFDLSEHDLGYEIKLREVLSNIWIQLLTLIYPLLDQKDSSNKTNDKIKSMMVYIHEHYGEKISIGDIAAAAFASERECFRVFHDCLHMTPLEYVKSYRLQMACHMLAKSHETITSISQSCGLGSSSYFGKFFKEQMRCTPIEYRHKWQKSDI